MFTNNVIEQVQKDIDHWVKTFVEESNEFYDNRFPVCPYARSARLANESTVQVYDGSGVKKFISEKQQWLIDHDQYFVMLMIFPTRVGYYPGIKKFIKETWKSTVPEDYFSLGGFANHTKCAFPGLLNNGEYYVIGMNKLSKVLPAVEILKKKGYYDYWSAEHHKDIVEIRQQAYEKYKDK